MKERLGHSSELILRSLAAEPLSYWQLLTEVSVDYPSFLRGIRQCFSRRYVSYQDKQFILSQEGKKTVKDRKLDKRIDYNLLIAKLTTITSQRPERREELDQAFAPPEVILERVKVMERNVDIANRDILLIGDGDCLGVALAMTELPRTVLVVDCDERLLELYQNLKLLGLEVVNQDLRNPLPINRKGEYDVFFTDPTPTMQVMTLFLSRGLSGLRSRGGVGYLTMSEMEASPKKWQKMQKTILKSGCVITEIVKGLNTYELEGDWLMESSWRVITQAPVLIDRPQQHWYRSSLVRLEAIKKPTAPIEDSVNWDDSMYMDDELLG